MFNFMTTFSVLAMVSLAAAGPINNVTIGPSADIGCTTSTIMQTQLNGNGNPHQNFVYKQSETVGWSVSISGAADFITGGFQVSASTTTGFSNSFGCATNGGTQSGSLCVFERIQLTAYTVNSRTCIENSCTGATCGGWGENVVIYAPNSNQGSCFYDNFQLNLPCLGLGSEQYVYNGPAGGPQYISC